MVNTNQLNFWVCAEETLRDRVKKKQEDLLDANQNKKRKVYEYIADDLRITTQTKMKNIEKEQFDTLFLQHYDKLVMPKYFNVQSIIVQASFPLET